MRVRSSLFVLLTIAACGGSGDRVDEGEEVGVVSSALPKPPKCKAGYAECNGNTKQGDRCEAFLATDPNNCGTCGTSCSAPNRSNTCQNGGCVTGPCNSGFADCSTA